MRAGPDDKAARSHQAIATAERPPSVPCVDAIWNVPDMRLADYMSIDADSLKVRGAPCSKSGRKLSKADAQRSEEHTSELQSLMRTSYAVFCLKKKNT